MRGLKLAVLAAVLVLGSGALAQGLDFSGAWENRLSFAGGELASTSSFTLALNSPDWTLSTTLNLGNGLLSGSEIEFTTYLGAVSLAAGASFRVPDARLAFGSESDLYLTGLELTGWHLSLNLSLGNLKLGITFAGGAEPKAGK